MASQDEMFPEVPNSEQGSRKANEAGVIKDQNLKAMQRGEMGIILITFHRGILGRADTARHWTKKPSDTSQRERTSSALSSRIFQSLLAHT